MKLTYDDLVRLPDDGRRHELIDGEPYVTPAPGYDHQSIVANLTTELVLFLRDHPLGDVLNAPFDVVFASHTVVQPDVIYFSRQRARHIVTQAHLTGAPELVVEVESPSTWQRDRTVKRELYERAGVSELWLIDPREKAVAMHRRADEGTGFAATPLLVRMPDFITTPLLPGLVLSLERLFEERTPR